MKVPLWLPRSSTTGAPALWLTEKCRRERARSFKHQRAWDERPTTSSLPRGARSSPVTEGGDQASMSPGAGTGPWATSRLRSVTSAVVLAVLRDFVPLSSDREAMAGCLGTRKLPGVIELQWSDLLHFSAVHRREASRWPLRQLVAKTPLDSSRCCPRSRVVSFAEARSLE